MSTANERVVDFGSFATANSTVNDQFSCSEGIPQNPYSKINVD